MVSEIIRGVNHSQYGKVLQYTYWELHPGGPGGRYSPIHLQVLPRFAGRTRDGRRGSVRRFRRKSRSDLNCGFFIIRSRS
eukprot:466138-Prymnesium_polylepis.1